MDKIGYLALGIFAFAVLVFFISNSQEQTTLLVNNMSSTTAALIANLEEPTDRALLDTTVDDLKALRVAVSQSEFTNLHTQRKVIIPNPGPNTGMLVERVLWQRVAGDASTSTSILSLILSDEMSTGTLTVNEPYASLVEAYTASDLLTAPAGVIIRLSQHTASYDRALVLVTDAELASAHTNGGIFTVFYRLFSNPFVVVQSTPVPSTPVPEPPLSTALLIETGPTTITLGENHVALFQIGIYTANRNTIIWSLSGTDAAYFDIKTVGLTLTGILTAHDSFDYENPEDSDLDNTYNFTITVTDTTDSTTDTRDVSVTVQNIEESQHVALSSANTVPRIGEDITASLVADDDYTNLSWQWSRSLTSTSDYVDIAGATSETYTPTASDPTYYLRATATYDTDFVTGQTRSATTASAVAP